MAGFTMPPDDMPLSELVNYPPDEVAQIMATEYDPAIQDVLAALQSTFGFTHEEWDALITENQALAEKVFCFPGEDPTLAMVRDHQRAVDLMVLGAVSFEFRRRVRGQES